MIEGFLETIRGVGIFIVCAQAVLHFRPKASYDKYLKVLVSVIVLVMLIVPCFQFFGNTEKFLLSMERYEDFLSGTGQQVWQEYEAEPEEAEPVKEHEPIETVVIEPVEVAE